jgi:hypothetical protein
VATRVTQFLSNPTLAYQVHRIAARSTEALDALDQLSLLLTNPIVLHRLIAHLGVDDLCDRVLAPLALALRLPNNAVVAESPHGASAVKLLEVGIPLFLASRVFVALK